MWGWLRSGLPDIRIPLSSLMTDLSGIKEAFFGAVCLSAEYTQKPSAEQIYLLCRGATVYVASEATPNIANSPLSYMQRTGTLPRSGKAEGLPFRRGAERLS